MSNTSKPELPNRTESFLQRLFERVGGALDVALKRTPAGLASVDVGELIPLVERAVQAHLRREGTQTIAPHLIELRYDYETYQQLTPEQRAYLQRELKASAYEYIVNHRLTTRGQVEVQIAFDVFTRKLTIKAHFGEGAVSTATATAGGAAASAADERRGNAAAVTAGARIFTVIFTPRDARCAAQRAQLSTATQPRAGIGRSRDNAFCLPDTSVSSFHAALTLSANGELWLTDLGSSNGTFVNGEPLPQGARIALNDGATVQFGEIETTFTFV